MKHWHETRAVLEEIDDLMLEEKQAALATIVRVQGSSYRRPGAKMLIAKGGATIGSVSAGCLESDLREVARAVMRSGIPVLQRYCSSSDDIKSWDLGLGCDGQIEIYVEPVHEERWEEAEQFDDDSPFALCTRLYVDAEDPPSARALADGRLIVVKDRYRQPTMRLEGTLGSAALDSELLTHAQHAIDTRAAALVEVGGAPIFIDPFHRPPELFIFGGGDDARPLALMAATSGFETTVVDWRASVLNDDGRFGDLVRCIELSESELLAPPDEMLAIEDGAFVVIMTHDFAHDAEYLQYAARFRPRYVGILGPHQRAARLLATLGDRRFDDGVVHAPIGLDLGAEGPEGIAIAILSEMLAAHSGRKPVSLRERAGSIQSGV